MYTTGDLEAGTKSGDFVVDHFPANRVNPPENPPVGLPQAIKASNSQGGTLSAISKDKDQLQAVKDFFDYYINKWSKMSSEERIQEQQEWGGQTDAGKGSGVDVGEPGGEPVGEPVGPQFIDFP